MDSIHCNPILLSAAIWLFYAAFIVLGIGIGLIAGYFLANMLAFAIFGFVVGVGLGILTNAILFTRKAFRGF